MLIRLQPHFLYSCNFSLLTVPGFTSMVISAPSFTLYSFFIVSKIACILPSGRKEGVPGEIFQEKGRLYVCCGDGTLLEVLELQCQGKKRMQAGDFLRGHSFEPGERFELSPQ